MSQVNDITAEDIMKVFWWGVDYGQLLAEQERDSEDNFDAFQCGIVARKFCVPSTSARRRQPHSNEWREVKEAGFKGYLEILAKAIKKSVG